MADLKQLEYFVLRYVPDAVNGEFINFGLILMEPIPGDAVFAKARFISSWKRAVCLYPDTDVDYLQSLSAEIHLQLAEPRNREFLLKWLRDSSSTSIQISETKTYLAEDPEKEIELLNQMYLEHNPRTRAAMKLSGREGIRNQVANAFENAGVLNLLMVNIPVAPYSKAGDPLKFDFGYRVGDTVKFFHAVSLKKSVDQAVMLAARYPKIVSGITREAKANPLLTAVIDDHLDRSRDEVRFALGAMEDEGIRLAIVADMPLIAETARVELRA